MDYVLGRTSLSSARSGKHLIRGYEERLANTKADPHRMSFDEAALAIYSSTLNRTFKIMNSAVVGKSKVKFGKVFDNATRATSLEL
jgi:hypothetical protein